METHVSEPVETPSSSLSKTTPFLLIGVSVFVLGTAVSGYIGFLYGKSIVHPANYIDSGNYLPAQNSALDSNNNVLGTPMQTPPQTRPWSTYISHSEGFSIDYPQEIADYEGPWKYEEYTSNDGTTTTGFGPISVIEDSIWAINVYTGKGIEEIISRHGSQFKDRKESRENIFVNGRPAILLTVTTAEHPDWISKNVLIENDGKLYSISNGEIEIPEFTQFYQSFKIIN